MTTVPSSIHMLNGAVKDIDAAIDNLTQALELCGNNALLAMVIIDAIGPARELHDRIAMIADRAKDSRQ